jgi:predicted ArsR family transcriptional regulator
LNKEGQGRPEGTPTLKEQGRTKNPSEAGKDYRDALSSIRADQDLETFIADLRQNKEQLLSFLVGEFHSCAPKSKLRPQGCLKTALEKSSSIVQM